MDLLHQMRVLVTVMDQGGFAAAARELRLSPAAVTRSIAALEAQLGASLLQRNTRMVRATEAGLRYYEDCKRILAEVQEAQETAAGQQAEPQGRLVLTAPVLFGAMYAMPLIGAFLRAYPKTEVQALMVDRVVNLVDEGVDLAFRIGRLPDSGLHAQVVGQVRLVVCAAPAYLAERGEPQHPRELQDHDCIATAGLTPTSEWRFQDEGRALSVRLRPRLWCTTNDSAIAAASQGLGVARALSYQVAEPLREGRLRVLLGGFEPEVLPVHIVYPQGRHAPSRVRRFIEMAAATLRADPSLR